MKPTTPLPWHAGTLPTNAHLIYADAEGRRMRMEVGGTTLYPVARTIDYEGEAAGNAAYIAHAANHYPDLVDALGKLMRAEWMVTCNWADPAGRDRLLEAAGVIIAECEATP